ncbi:MAG: NfeD family protein [Sphingopyxis sp.]
MFENTPLYIIWFSVGLLLCIAEMLLPGVFLLWLGVAGLLTGLITLALPVGLAGQLFLFAALAIISMYVGRNWAGNARIASDDPLLNDRAGRLIGQVVTLSVGIEGNAAGRARVGDGEWTASGPATPAGASVRIIAVNGNILTVEPA